MRCSFVSLCLCVCVCVRVCVCACVCVFQHCRYYKNFTDCIAKAFETPLKLALVVMHWNDTDPRTIDMDLMKDLYANEIIEECVSPSRPSRSLVHSRPQNKSTEEAVARGTGKCRDRKWLNRRLTDIAFRLSAV